MALNPFISYIYAEKGTIEGRAEMPLRSMLKEIRQVFYISNEAMQR